MTKVRKVAEGERMGYPLETQILTVTMVPDELKGTPSEKTYSKEELEAAVTIPDMRYTTLAEEWNEYVVDDGARIRLKTTVSRVARTDKNNREGEPIYLVETSGMAQIRPPRP